MVSYTSGNILLYLEVEGKPDSQVLSTIEDVVTTDVEYYVSLQNLLTLALKNII